MTPDERALRAAITAAPADAAPCLVYADWLDDAGRADAARHWRHKGRRLDAGLPPKPTIPEVLGRCVDCYRRPEGHVWRTIITYLTYVKRDEFWAHLEIPDDATDECRQLVAVLRRMSPTQRRKLARRVRLRSGYGYPNLMSPGTFAPGYLGHAGQIIGFATGPTTFSVNTYAAVTDPEAPANE